MTDRPTILSITQSAVRWLPIASCYECRHRDTYRCRCLLTDRSDNIHPAEGVPSWCPLPANAQISGGTPSAESDCSARGCHNCGHGHLGGWKMYRKWPCLTCRIGSGLCCGDDNWKPNSVICVKEGVEG